MQSATHQTLVNLVEAHVTALVRESATVNRHSRRGGLLSAADEPTTTSKSSASNNTTNNQGGGRQKRRRLIHHDDINMALQWRGSEKLYVSGVSVPHHHAPTAPDNNDTTNKKKQATLAKNALTQLLQNTTSSSTVSVSSLLKGTHVPRIDLNAYLQSELVIPPPSELGMTLHWLAVDGISPMIPMNEVWNNRHGGGGNSPLAPALLQLDDDSDNEQHNTTKTSSSDTSIRIRELQQRLLSEELQLYFSQVTSTIEQQHSSLEVNTALHGIRTDSGIQELIPFLSRYVAMGLGNKKSLQNVSYCLRLIQVLDAMLDNPNVHLDLHLHQMLSPVGTCIVTKKLGRGEEEDHWSLRESAARTLVKACNLYGMQYTTMKPRIMKLLTQQALRLDRPLATQYGGIVGLTLFGPRAVDAFLLPVAREYWEFWEKELQALEEEEKERDVGKEYEVHMCQQALLDGVAVFLRGVTPGEQAKRVDVESFLDVFGERLIPMQSDVTEYVSAIL